jgi:putative FmdB family regulatory protein
MPVYEYAHVEQECELGREFELTQSIKAEAIKVCPQCGQAVQRLISRTFISMPKGNSDLKSMGFTKLVKRDTGVYENVTRHEGESKYMISGQPDTIPKFKDRIAD